MSEGRVTLTLEGWRARKVVHRLAYDYAYLWAQSVATVRDAPTWKPGQEAGLRSAKAALLSITSLPGLVKELPAVPDPEWPVRYRGSDEVVTKSKLVSVGDVHFRRVLNTKMKKGARQAPTYSSHAVSNMATAWATAFCLSIGIPNPEAEE